MSHKAVAKLHREDDALALVAVLRAYESGHIALTCAELQVLQQACAGTVYLTEQSVRAAVEQLDMALRLMTAGVSRGHIQAVRDWLEAELP